MVRVEDSCEGQWENSAGLEAESRCVIRSLGPRCEKALEGTKLRKQTVELAVGGRGPLSAVRPSRSTPLPTWPLFLPLVSFLVCILGLWRRQWTGVCFGHGGSVLMSKVMGPDTAHLESMQVRLVTAGVAQWLRTGQVQLLSRGSSANLCL